MNISDIATPAYVFDEEVLVERVRKVKEFFGKSVAVCFAIKANPFLVGVLNDVVDCFEVCSPGEFRICERVGIAPEKIVLSGVYKNPDDIERIVGVCGCRTTYTAESPLQVELLCDLAVKYGLTLRVLLRLSAGNQFGMDEETVTKIMQRMQNSALNIVGLQYYSGTQKREDKLSKETQKLAEFVQRLEADGLAVGRIEYGSGLKVGYFPAEHVDEDGEMRTLTEALKVFDGKQITLEFGRFLTADCGSYYTQIVDAKRTDGVNYAIVDGGINHLNYYGQTMAMKVPYFEHFGNNAAAETDGWTVCGSLCTTADVLVRNLPLACPQVGDIIRFDKVGAYSVTEGIYLFLSRDLPNVYFKRGGKLTLVRKSVHTDEINYID